MATPPKRHFHELLDLLQARLLEMAGEAEAQIGRVADAFFRRDGGGLSSIRDRDALVDALELEVDERALELLALQQPMAKDLRQIVATLKIANDLERVADHAVKMSWALERILASPSIPNLPEIEEMFRLSRGLLSDALRAFTVRDTTLARAVRVRDEEVNRLRNAVHRSLVSRMISGESPVEWAVSVQAVAQSLERVADLSTNIAEETVFLVEGRVVRHQPEVGE
jgi:phosphate transport system protein